MLLVASLFDSMVNFKVFLYLLRLQFQTHQNLNHPLKRSLPIVPPFYLGVDFGVFDLKIWVFHVKVLIWRSQLLLSL
jgi:hypothetical protein